VKLVHWLVTAPLTLLLIDFAVSNLEQVPVGLWPFSDVVLAPLYLVVLAALLLGFLLGELVAWVNGRRWRREARRRARRIEALERELAATQAKLPSAEHPASRLPAREMARN
jgi:putative membrane protein